MYEDDWPLDARQKVRALLVDSDANLVLLQRLKPNKPAYHVTAGGKVERGEAKREALVRELREELDATVVLGRAFLTTLDTTYYVAHLVELGPHPFTGPEFSDEKLGRYAIARVPLAEAISSEIDLQPYIVRDFLSHYGQAVLAEAKRLSEIKPRGKKHR
jgi:ADP-ribose pyrophosphatase YjhB (NUDIX family)